MKENNEKLNNSSTIYKEAYQDLKKSIKNEILSELLQSKKLDSKKLDSKLDWNVSESNSFNQSLLDPVVNQSIKAIGSKVSNDSSILNQISYVNLNDNIFKESEHLKQDDDRN